MAKYSQFKGRALLTLQTLFMVTIIFYPFAKNLNNLLAILGGFVFVLAFCIFSFAKKGLDSAFYPLPEPKNGAPLIISGIYSIVRHPMYVSFLIGGFGICMLKQNVILLLLLLGLFLILTAKYKYEDALLIKKWERAVEYQQSTPALFPIFKKK